ncbi:neuralized-like protein 4 [Saccoglossus kowalevskii]
MAVCVSSIQHWIEQMDNPYWNMSPSLTPIVNINTYCGYYQICRRYLNSLHLPASTLWPCMEYDTCYCVHCHGVRGDAMYYERGTPSKLYALPIGWVRFPLK